MSLFAQKIKKYKGDEQQNPKRKFKRKDQREERKGKSQKER
jgi:hypothetical protein